MNVLTHPRGGAGQPPAEQRFLLQAVGWQAYETVLKALGDRSGVRLTYDRGDLELMSPSYEHETAASLLGRFIELLTLELKIPIKAGGSTTFRRQDLDRGLEPDRCFYVQHAVHLRGRREIDLSRDPPPDLAIEVDITSSSLDRLGIYAALGVPEVWRYDGEALHVYHRRSDGTYAEGQGSLAFPFLPVTELVTFLRQGDQTDDTALAQAFLEWVRQRVVPNRPGTAPGGP
jgi:Uma2 family endonuclease